MALKIVKNISEKNSGKWHTAIVDETVVFFSKEQVLLCLLYVNDDMKSSLDCTISLYISRGNCISN